MELLKAFLFGPCQASGESHFNLLTVTSTELEVCGCTIDTSTLKKNKTKVLLIFVDFFSSCFVFKEDVEIDPPRPSNSC